VSFLLDTNVVSEWAKPRPDPGVVTWLTEIDEDRVFISVVTLAELQFGIERMPPGNRRARLSRWLQEELPLRFEGRLLPINEAVAETWGKTVARCEMIGRPIRVMRRSRTFMR
jgi:predicted nucleic acid-binding protein